ncbi:MAG: type I DNA topoisomerase [Dehalococcoidia bacterium]|nr:type I DNA topoisomerase [Dehalococcoidia bacterium]
MSTTKPKHAPRARAKKGAINGTPSPVPSASAGRPVDADGTALVVVESPTKARTIGRILGDRYHVVASMGHVRDLPKGKLGVLVKDDFDPEYVTPPDKRSVIKGIKDRAAGASMVYLATDPDREGEAISWHIASAAGIGPEKQRRVVFHEITEEAVREAFNHPRDIDMRLVQAQQARRILDRLVGYQLSPLLWRKVQRGLSAGRVQSVALRLVVERDRAIGAFVPVEYWSLEALLRKAADGAQARQFSAQLHSIQGEKDRISLPNQTATDTVLNTLERASYSVGQVVKREVHRRPAPPFITSTLQQEANRKLRWAASRTMAIAQQLYEGVALGSEGSTGLITYMRTDSTDVAASALQETRSFIRSAYGSEYLPAAPRVYTRKVKGAQEAHEAIRPTASSRTPQAMQRFLSPDQHRLYDLVWKRMVASQMSDAVLDATQVDVTATPAQGVAYIFRANGSVMKFPGFRTLYMESTDTGDDEDKENRLPELTRGDALACARLEPKQHFTEPPPHYTEASLIKALEEDGIGRPSTYAPIIGTIIARNYVTRERGSLRSTKLGAVVNDQLVGYFPQVMDLGFTAHMEEELDDVASGEREWVPVVREFYDPFELALKEAQANMPRVSVDEPSNEVCELCARPMVIKSGRFGRFLSCSSFPECRASRPLVIRTGVDCPQCGGDLVERKARKGGPRATFYGCSNYPTCSFTVNSKPLQEPCPECGGLLVTAGRRASRCTKCAYRGDVVQEAVDAGAE